MSASLLYVLTYYKRTRNMSRICQIMRSTPETDTLLICNGDINRIQSYTYDIPVIVTDNRWKNFQRHIVIQNFLRHKTYDHVLLLDDDVIPSFELPHYFLSGSAPHTIVGGWGYRIDGDDYTRRTKIEDGSECHYMGAGITLYPSDFYRHLNLMNIDANMMVMDDIWLSYMAKCLNYRLLGMSCQHWQFKGNDDRHATYLRLGENKKRKYWRALFVNESH